MIDHLNIERNSLAKKIRSKEICFGGNKKLKIFGSLTCASGKRLKKENRIFFLSEKEALQNGFRPCGNCMRKAYKKFNNGPV